MAVPETAVPQVDGPKPTDNAEVSTPAPATEAAGAEAEPQANAQEDEREETEHKGKRLPGSARAKRKVEFLEAEVARLRKAQEQAPVAGDTGFKFDKPKPIEADFQTHEEHMAAVAKWAVQEHKAQEHYLQQRAFDQRVDSLKAEGATMYPDFIPTVTAPGLPFTPEILSIVLESELGVELAYHLAKNPDELRRLASLPPRRLDRALDALEERLAAEVEEPESPSVDEESAVPLKTVAAQPKKQLPSPPTPVRAKSGTAKAFDPLDPSTYGDFAEYEKRMNARDVKRHSG